MRRVALGDHGPSILVASLGSAFGVCLLQVVGALTAMIESDPTTGSSDTVALLLSLVAFVFIVIAVYVSSIVTSNTFATIVAGRTRTIALLRLIGSSAAMQRRAVAREGLAVGVIGGLAGALVGTGLTAAGLAVGVAAGTIPDIAYPLVAPVLALPPVAVVLTTWLASWTGSRRVLVVSPMQAIGAAEELSAAEAGSRRGRNAAAITLFAVGIGLLVLGMIVGLVSFMGVLVGIVGGILSFTGVVLGAQLVMPPVLRLVGRALGRSAPARLAAENAVRYPERSSRTTIGLVIGVTLVTMFAVAVSSYRQVLHSAQEYDPVYYAGIDEMLAVTVAVFSVLIGFSALIAAVGMVNNLSLSVLQRRRELGLLRALGFTARQVRRMILAESAQLTVSAVLVGLVLGTFYGWAGAQSMFGSIWGSPGIVAPALPLGLLAIVVAAAALLTVAASVVPSRRATRIAPVAALAVD
jgi:putative ABC transport system permease protein